MEHPTLQERLDAWLEKAFLEAYPGADPEARALWRALPTADERHGDYQCNAAMGLARLWKQAPRALANKLVAAAPPNDLVAEISVAGPGFINLRLALPELARVLEQRSADPRLGVGNPGNGRRILFDYSSPNVAKPMHIGHIRSTVIGNALDRMYRFLGFDVIADNHLGDWGTQFGLLLLGYRHFVDEKALQETPVEELERVYRLSYERTKSDPEWREEARRELVRLQSGAEESLRLWRHCVTVSKAAFDPIYRRLGVRFDLERGESFYHDRLPDVIARMQAAGLIEESEGALIVRHDDEALSPSIVRKSDGGFNYTTTDIATVLQRVAEFAPEQIVYITDERQQLHFQQLFSIMGRLGCEVALRHVWFGLMRLPEGTFSTREGNVIRLERLLDEAEARALELVRSAGRDLAPGQQAEVARAIGIGAVKYADLSQNPQSLVTFTWEKALALEGNSAPYLQYAHARIASVRDKYAERFPGRTFSAEPLRIETPHERRLALHLARFPETLQAAAEAFRPNQVADYLYALAQHYSSFYQNVPFFKAPDGVRESRVRLCDLTARTLRTGLSLLGIETPDRI